MSRRHITSVVDDVTDRLVAAEQYVDSVSRMGLSVVILLAGVHRLVDPGAWAVYVVEWVVPVLPMTPVEFMLLNGVLEPPFALALLSDRYTTFAAAFVTASLLATVLYLSVVFATSGRFADVIIRDVGLAALAATVTVRAAAARQ